jgi:two-component system response regulator MprA
MADEVSDPAARPPEPPEPAAPYAEVVARIGICEDDPAIRRVLAEGLRMAGHDVLAAHDGAEAMRLFTAADDLDVLILDIGLPDADGRDVCQALRAGGQQAPVLFLTAYDALHDRLSGFNAGGDDYVTKPFAIKEILVRVAALVRRTAPSPVAEAAAKGLTLDPNRHALVTESAEVPLSPTEYRILAAIAGRPGEVVRRRAVVAAAWPDGAVVSENTVDTYIRRVRSKLEQAGSPMRLHTVRGVGFSLR